MRKRIVVKKHIKDMFPVEECIMDDFWKDLIENNENKNGRTSNNIKRHPLRSEKQ